MNKEQILKQVKLIFSSYLKKLHLDYLPSASSVERHDEIEGFFIIHIYKSGITIKSILK